MRKRIALIAAPLVSIGLVVTAAMPAEAATHKIKAKAEKKSYTGIILHGTDDKGGIASSINAPAIVIEPGQTKKGTLVGKNCAVWIPAHSRLIFFKGDPLYPTRTKKNSTGRGYDWVFEKGSMCTGGFTKWHFRLYRL